MRFLSIFFTGAAAASLCLSAFAQTTDQGYGSQQQPAPATAEAPAVQTQAPAPVQQTPQLKLENLPPDPHTPTPEEEAAQAAARQRAQIQRVAVTQANWGPKASSPGITLTMKETGREKVAAGTIITYRLTATGFAVGTRLNLLRWPLNDSVSPVMGGIVIDASGNAVCGPPAATLSEPGAGAPAQAGTQGTTPGAPRPDPAITPCTRTMKANAPVEIATTAARGEAIRVALVAEDRKSGAAASVTPFPDMGEDKGCKLEVLLGSKDAELVLIKGEGFKPDVPFTLGAETFGQKITIGAKPDAQGNFFAAMTPYVQGHDSGDTVVYYQSDACTPTVSFHWGKGSYKAE